ncbi:MAG: cytochrome c [Acidobacteriota bacterium]|nr:cytochrome c [Acidobacteriota bacterium]
MKAVLKAVLVLVVLVAVAAGFAAYSVTSRGLSTRVEPSTVEEQLALAMRRLATPTAERERGNPVELTDAVMEDALEHFADHCASCHANDGSGETEMGRSLYPPAPDMRAARTQGLTDGELFAIIEHGIRLTGMPAWGTATPEGEAASWALVHFIRRLPRLTAEEKARMEEFNPKSAAQFREEEETRRFLAGEEPTPAEPPPAHEGPHD